MNKQELIEKIKANGEWFETNRYVKITKVIELVNQIDQPQKVKMPKLVAGWIELCKEKADLSSCLNGYYEIGDGTIVRPRGLSETFYDWLSDYDHMHDLARAYLDGYEVGEEPLFYIRLTIPSSSVVELYLGFNKDGIFDHSYGKPHVTWDWKCTFTEHEIKAIDERYWPFAIPVEKV